MKLVLSIKSLFITLCLMIFLTGCLSFSKNQLPSVNLEKLPEGSKKSTVSYSFTSGENIFSKKDHNEITRKILENEFIEVLNESGYFSIVSSSGQADLNMQVRLVVSEDPAAIIPAILTGLTLYSIPSWVSTNFETTTKILALNKKEYNYALTDSMVTISWFPMIVVTPFFHPISISKTVRRNIWKNLIIKMQKDGLLPPPLSLRNTMIFLKIINLKNT